MQYSLAFKSLLKSTDDRTAFLSEVPYRRSVPFLSKDAEEAGLSAPGERDAIFVMTDSGADREGDVIISQGVDVEQFRNYGSILWGHRADLPEFVLGTPAEVAKEETRILVRTTFLKEDANPTAERVLRMIQAGGVRAMSVGILLREYSEAQDRAGYLPLNIIRSELIETSVTPVPMNPRAVLLAAGGEKNTSEAKAVAELFEAVADDEAHVAQVAESAGLTVPQTKDLVQRALDELLGKTAYSVPSGDPVTDALNYYARLAAHNGDK